MERQQERGQVLVLIALSLVALVALVALAVDGGLVYSERRSLQNAADAGALAGAQEICFGTPANAPATAREYATIRNGAEGADVTVSGLFSITVVATRTVHTYFAGVIGFRDIAVQADATAVCGSASAGGGIWPIAFDGTRWPEDASLQCDQTILFYAGDTSTDCDIYDCCRIYDEQKTLIHEVACGADGKPLIYPVDGRAWVDFTQGISGSDPCDSGGCGTNELKYRIDGENNTGEICENFLILGNCYERPQGENTSAVGYMEDRAQDIVGIPLYDPCESGKLGDVVIGNDPNVYPTPICNPSDTPCTVGDGTTSSKGCTNERYRLTEMACVQVGVKLAGTEDWAVLGHLADRATGKVDKSTTVLLATIPCENGAPHPECASSSGWTYGGVPRPGSIKAVTLID